MTATAAMERAARARSSVRARLVWLRLAYYRTTPSAPSSSAESSSSGNLLDVGDHALFAVCSTGSDAQGPTAVFLQELGDSGPLWALQSELPAEWDPVSARRKLRAWVARLPDGTLVRCECPHEIPRAGPDLLADNVRAVLREAS